MERAATGTAGYEMALARPFDLIVLDGMLPGKNGFDICRDLRREGVNAPVLMLTARGEVVDRVVGLKLGADDYVQKNCEPVELMARIEALLRRSGGAAAVTLAGPAGRADFGDVRIDLRKHEVTRAGTVADAVACGVPPVRISHRRAARRRGDARAGTLGKGLGPRRGYAQPDGGCAHRRVAEEDRGRFAISAISFDGERCGVQAGVARLYIPYTHFAHRTRHCEHDRPMKPFVCAMLVSCCAALGQQPAAKISFEVVSIKPAAPRRWGKCG